MSVIQKSYLTVSSVVVPTYDPWDPTPYVPPTIPTVIKDPIASERLPDWFINADKKFKKIIRVLGSTIIEIDELKYNPDDRDLKSGWRLYSNINPHSNLPMKTATTEDDAVMGKFQISPNIGFIMMVNNYDCVKEFDITNENINVVEFYLRPRTFCTEYTMWFDCVVELEILLIFDA